MSFRCDNRQLMRQRHCRIVLLVMWIALHAPLRLSAAADEGFTPLFNGRNLQGWVAVGPAEAFIVRDSAIFSTRLLLSFWCYHFQSQETLLCLPSLLSRQAYLLRF